MQSTLSFTSCMNYGTEINVIIIANKVVPDPGVRKLLGEKKVPLTTTDLVFTWQMQSDFLAVTFKFI